MAKQKQQQTLPKKVFVYEEQDGNNTFLVAERERDATADTDSRIVGTYVLQEIGETKQKAQYKRQRFVR